MNKFLMKVKELNNHFKCPTGYVILFDDWSGEYFISRPNVTDKVAVSFFDFHEFYEKANKIINGKEL